MIFDLEQVVDLAVSGSELGIINLSILNPLLHIIVRELGLEKKRVHFLGAFIKTIEESNIEPEFESRFTFSEYVDTADEQRVIVVNSLKDEEFASDEGPHSTHSFIEPPQILEAAVNADLQKLTQRFDELAEVVRSLLKQPKDPEPDIAVLIDRKERVTWQDIEFKKQEQFSERLYERLLKQLNTDATLRQPQVNNIEKDMSQVQNKSIVIQEYPDTQRHSTISLSEPRVLDKKEDQNNELDNNKDSKQVSSDAEDEEAEIDDQLQTEQSKDKEQQLEIGSNRLDKMEEDIVELRSIVHACGGSYGEIVESIVNEPQFLVELNKIDGDVADLRSKVHSIIEDLKNFTTIQEANEPQINLTRLDKIEEDVADLKTKVQSAEECLRNVEGAVVEVPEHFKIEQTVEPSEVPSLLVELRTDLNQLNTQLSDQLQANFLKFVDEFEKRLNDLQMPSSVEKDEFEKSLLTLQDDLNAALSEIHKMLNAKVNQSDISELKQNILGLLEVNKLEIQKKYGLNEVTTAAGTSKQLKGVQCLSCGKAVEQCKIDEPKKMTQLLIHHRPVDDRPRSRPCGGAHTITSPEERIEKRSNFLEEFGVESLPPTTTTYLVGSDGRYYLAAPTKCHEDEKSE